MELYSKLNENMKTLQSFMSFLLSEFVVSNINFSFWQVDVTEGNAEEVAEFLVNQTSSNSSSSESDVEAISQILENIVSAGSGDPEVRVKLSLYNALSCLPLAKL